MLFLYLILLKSIPIKFSLLYFVPALSEAKSANYAIDVKQFSHS